jgi:tetratricopeptide (TPR) repeat protein
MFGDAYKQYGRNVLRLQKKYGKAIKEYEKAIKITAGFGSFFSNLGAAYFPR